MSESAFLEKLLDGAEVEWVPLAEGENRITELKRGRVMSKGYLVENSGDYPVYSSQTARNGQIGKIKTFDFDGESITWTTDGANAGTVFHRTGKFSITNVCGIIRICDVDRLNYRYLFHYLSFNTQKHVYAGMGNPKLMSNQMAKIPIPIPCPENPEKSLAIQAEIVRILDTFTELTAELTAELISELTARKKQFNYYRDQLLTFEEGDIEWKTLGEVGEFVRGKRFVKADMISEGVPCIHYGEMYTHYGIWADKAKSCVTSELVKKNKLRTAEKGNVVMVAAGETIEDIGMGTAWLSDEGVVIHDACFTYRSGLNPKYVAYFTRTKFFQSQVRKSVSSGKISAINAKGLSKVTIPIPSIAEQARIVGILDKFDTLTHSISEGLPREIELRQKQYEYYRGLLLNFPIPEPETEGVA